MLHVTDELPQWIVQYLGKKFVKEEQSEVKARDMSSVDEVRKRYLKSKAESDGCSPDNPKESQDIGQVHRRGR